MIATESYTCSRCDARFDDEYKFFAHRRKHGGWRCNMCGTLVRRRHVFCSLRCASRYTCEKGSV